MKETWLRAFLKWFIITPMTLPALIFLTPLSRVFDLFTMYHPDLFRRANTPEKHAAKVRKIQDQIRKWNLAGRSKKLVTARPTWKTASARNMNKSKFNKINVDLEDFIEIDTVKKVLRVEPGMKMGTLTYKLLKQGWTIPVVPEWESLTVGGCVNGSGIESGAHKYGLFASSCVAFEIVLADGSCVTCSKKENPDLFYAIPWSHGTIGFLTAATIPLVKAGRYVKLEYNAVSSIEKAKNIIQEPGNHELLEGIAFGFNKIMIMRGKFADKAEPEKVNHISRWYKTWFFKHVESICDGGKKRIEYIPTRDYYHRYQRAFFWEMQTFLPFGNMALIRYLVGWVYPLNFQLLKFLFPESFFDFHFGDNHVLQDFMVPFTSVDSFFQLAHKEIRVYPLWICPCKIFKVPGMVFPKGNKDELYVNIGIYGDSPLKADFDMVVKMRKLEKFAIEQSGFGFLYSDIFMSKEEFQKMYDMRHYDKIRQKYKCEDAFPHVYDKISRAARSSK